MNQTLTVHGVVGWDYIQLVTRRIRRRCRRTARNCSIEQLLLVVGLGLRVGWIYGDYALNVFYDGDVSA